MPLITTRRYCNGCGIEGPQVVLLWIQGCPATCRDAEDSDVSYDGWRLCPRCPSGDLCHDCPQETPCGCGQRGSWQPALREERARACERNGEFELAS